MSSDRALCMFVLPVFRQPLFCEVHRYYVDHFKSIGFASYIHRVQSLGNSYIYLNENVRSCPSPKARGEPVGFEQRKMVKTQTLACAVDGIVDHLVGRMGSR